MDSAHDKRTLEQRLQWIADWSEPDIDLADAGTAREALDRIKAQDIRIRQLEREYTKRTHDDNVEMDGLRAELREAEHARDGYMAERDMARERLEWSPDQPYDGIAARDETIARLERNRDMWKGQCERQAARLSAMRDAGDLMAAVIEAATFDGYDSFAAVAALVRWEAGR